MNNLCIRQLMKPKPKIQIYHEIGSCPQCYGHAFEMIGEEYDHLKKKIVPQWECQTCGSIFAGEFI